MKRKGIYIVFEGIVGCGKTTQVNLLADLLRVKFPQSEIITNREPGGTEIAREIRKLVQATDFNEEMEPVCEQYLYAASRAQSLRKVVEPALKRGAIVISDRSFFTSLVNQGFGRGLGIEKVLEINKNAVENLWPDLVLLIDIDIKTSLSRIKDHDGDKFEKYDEKFYHKVHHGYRVITKKYPRLVKVIDGRGNINRVHRRIGDYVTKYLSSRLRI